MALCGPPLAPLLFEALLRLKEKKMKKRVKKLVLNRETVGPLQPTALKPVRGGDSAECVTADCDFSWWTCFYYSGCDRCNLTA